MSYERITSVRSMTSSANEWRQNFARSTHCTASYPLPTFTRSTLRMCARLPPKLARHFTILVVVIALRCLVSTLNVARSSSRYSWFLVSLRVRISKQRDFVFANKIIKYFRVIFNFVYWFFPRSEFVRRTIVLTFVRFNLFRYNLVLFNHCFCYDFRTV